MPDEDTRKATQEFLIRDVLIQYCGQMLTPENVDKIAAAMIREVQEGNCAWAFSRHA